MSESCCGQRPENCRARGGDLGREYHFAAMGACFCLPCWREIARTQRKGPPAQQMLALGQGVKPQPSCERPTENRSDGATIRRKISAYSMGAAMARKRTPQAAEKSAEAVPPVVAPSGPDGDEDADDPEGLTVPETAFVDALAAGGTLHDGATAAGISYRSAKRWHRKVELLAAIRSRTSASMSQARATLASSAARAARELSKLAESAKPDAARILACRSVIGHAAELGVLEELTDRLATLEAAQGKQPGRFFRKEI